MSGAASAPVGAVGFDTDAIISASAAAAFAADFSFCLRYLSLQAGQQEGDLSAGEALDIVGNGLALMPVQHVPEEGWHPSAALGSEYGSNAGSNALEVGIPAGVSVWLDLEGVAPGTPAQQVVQYCNAWFDSVSACAYVPGLYVGANCILNASELGQLKFAHYWKSLSSVPVPQPRGFQMVQSAGSAMHGIDVDLDQVMADNEGSTPLWWASRGTQPRQP